MYFQWRRFRLLIVRSRVCDEWNITLRYAKFFGGMQFSALQLSVVKTAVASAFAVLAWGAISSYEPGQQSLQAIKVEGSDNTSP